MFILFKFYHVRAGARTRARQFYFECWKFTENPKIEEFSENMILARARVRAGARALKNLKSMDSQLSLEKKIIKFG